jgi:hypothetical protein
MENLNNCVRCIRCYVDADGIHCIDNNTISCTKPIFEEAKILKVKINIKKKNTIEK